MSKPSCPRCESKNLIAEVIWPHRFCENLWLPTDLGAPLNPHDDAHTLCEDCEYEGVYEIFRV